VPASITKRRRRGSHQKRYSPKVLLQFIELANLLPPRISWPDPYKLEPEGRDRPFLEKFFSKFVELFPTMDFKTYLKRYPDGRDEEGHWVCHAAVIGLNEHLDKRNSKASLGWVWKGPLSWRLEPYGDPRGLSYFESLQASYALFHKVRTALSNLVRLKSVGRMLLGASASRLVYCDREGIIRIELDAYLDGFIPALDGAEVERIKRCPVCGKFFWAKPRNKGACSPKCLGLNRVRRWREKQRHYEKTRRINRVVRVDKIPIGEAFRHEEGRARRRLIRPGR